MAARHEQRAGMNADVRIRLLETDVDEVESDVAGINARIQKLTWAIVGAALSLTTAALLLAVNIAISA